MADITIRECRRCRRLLLPEACDDCPNHALPCCDGKGLQHALGCEQDPMYKVGQARARLEEEQIIKAVLNG